jgi:hypothetical protein
MKEFLELIIKYGATGVLALWLFMEHVTISELKKSVSEMNTALIDCYKERSYMNANIAESHSKDYKFKTELIGTLQKEPEIKTEIS